MSSTAVVQPFAQAHRNYVKKLYRQSLKNALNWYVRRDLWRIKAIELRVFFEKNRNIKDPRRVAALLKEVERECNELAHPDPYRPPMFPDGTKWERNLPPRMFSEEEKAAAAHH